MTTLILNHSDCEKHVMLPHHPESPARLRHVMDALEPLITGPNCQLQSAQEIDTAMFKGIHPTQYLDMLSELKPGEGIARIDADTSINQYSLRAARLAAGANITAVEAVMSGAHENAFCAVRPPGHHAEASIGMGFCIFNSVALAAERALQLGAERIAIIDFDVHHGNGTVEIFLNRPEVMVCSSFQYPFYPSRFDDVEKDHIVLTPLSEGTTGEAFRVRAEADWSAALARHQPDLILVSAGFDAHAEDPLAGLQLVDEDYAWISQFLLDQAERYCDGKLVSTLEGGYHLEALARCAAIHVNELSQRSRA